MYNSNEKLTYLEKSKLSPQTKGIIENIFEKFEPFEKKAGKDVSEFTPQELNNVISEGFSISKQATFNNIISAINRYKQWLNKGQIDEAKEISGALSVRKTMISSPFHLQYILDQGLKSPDSETTDVILRAMYWLKFAGLTNSQAARVTKGDIDFTAMNVMIDGIVFPIESFAVESLQFACKSDYLIIDNPTHKNTRKQFRTEGSTVLRCFSPSDNISGQCLRVSNIYKSRTSIVPPTLMNTWYSGFFYRTFLSEMMGVKPDFEFLARFLLSEKLEVYKNQEFTSDSLKNKTRNLQKNYDLWKLAFPRFTDTRNLFL